LETSLLGTLYQNWAGKTGKCPGKTSNLSPEINKIYLIKKCLLKFNLITSQANL
jgi:hypothetical protein